MQVQTLSNLRSAEFVLKFQNLNITLHEFKLVSGTHLLLFFNSVLETKTFCTFYSINFASHLQKEISMAAVSGKKINCKDRNSKLYFSKGIQNNLPRSNFSLLRLPQMLLEKTEKWEIWLPDCHFSGAGTWELVNLFVRTKSFSYHIC